MNWLKEEDNLKFKYEDCIKKANIMQNDWKPHSRLFILEEISAQW